MRTYGERGLLGFQTFLLSLDLGKNWGIHERGQGPGSPTREKRPKIERELKQKRHERGMAQAKKTISGV